MRGYGARTRQWKPGIGMYSMTKQSGLPRENPKTQLVWKLLGFLVRDGRMLERAPIGVRSMADTAPISIHGEHLVEEGGRMYIRGTSQIEAPRIEAVCNQAALGTHRRYIVTRDPWTLLRNGV